MYNQNGNNFMPHQGFNNCSNYNTQNFAYSLPRVNRYHSQYSVTSYPPPAIQRPSYPTTRVPMLVQNIPYDIVEPNHGTVHYDVSGYKYSTSDYYSPTIPPFSNESSSTNVSVNYQQNPSGLPCSSHQQDMFEPLPKAPQHRSGKVKPLVIVKEQLNTSEGQAEIKSVPSDKCESDSVSNMLIAESNKETNVSEGEDFQGSLFSFAEMTARERDSKIPNKRNMLCKNKDIVHGTEIDVFNKSVNFNEEHMYARNKSKILNTVSNTQANTCKMQDYFNQIFHLPTFENNQSLNKSLPNNPQVQFSYPFTPNEYSSSNNLSRNCILPPTLGNRFDSDITADQPFANTSKFFQTQIPSNNRYEERKIEGMDEISENLAKVVVEELDLNSPASRAPYAIYNSSNSVRQRWNENAQHDQNSQRSRVSNNMARLLSYNSPLNDPSISSTACQLDTTGKIIQYPRRCHSFTESSFDQIKQAFDNSSRSQVNFNSAKERFTISSNPLDNFYSLGLDNPMSISKESLTEMARYQKIIANDLKQNKRTSKTENSISYTPLRQDIENVSNSETNSRYSVKETGSSNMSQGTYRHASFKQSSLDILLDESKLIIHSYIDDTPHT